MADAVAATRRPTALRHGYWRSERVITDGDVWFAGLLADIAAAKHAIDYEVYLVDDDAMAARICAALCAAADRGVVVRLLVDGVGAADWIWKRALDLMRSPVALRVYHPLPGQTFSPAFVGRSRLWAAVRLLGTINRRNHRKQVLIDRRIAWVGSFNLSAQLVPSLTGERAWREAGARVEGPAIVELEQAFAVAWERSWRFNRSRLRMPALRPRPPMPIESGFVRLNHRMRLRRRRFQELIRRIGAARQRIWIAAAYFVPGRKLVRAIGDAAARGVEVRLVMSKRSDVRFMTWIAAAFQSALIRRGAQVFEYQPSILHAKTMLIDDWLSIGSTNLNSRSLLHDLEADLVLLQPGSIAAMRDAFKDYFARSREVCESDFAARPWHERFLARVALQFRYYL